MAGKPVGCSHCAYDRFVEGRAQLNTAGMTFFDLEWASRSAATLACTRCGHIEWFLEDPEARSRPFPEACSSGAALPHRARYAERSAHSC